MGLDSVELVIEWEKFFGISIPDIEAGKIGTIQEAADYISSQVKYVDKGIDIKAEMMERFVIALKDLNVIKRNVTTDQKIVDILSINDKNLFKDLSKRLNYELPIPDVPKREGWLAKRIYPSSKIDFEQVTLDRFIDLTCSINYEKLVKGQPLQSNYEVLISVMGSTIDKMGLNPYEVFPHSRFTYDLGID